jgi:short-subunit dehydrogenase
MAKALVTGGSSGIGLAFARQLAAENYDLILLARDRQRLKRTAQKIRRDYGIKVEILASDLAKTAEINKVLAKIRRLPDLAILVNCAGFGLHQSLVDDDRFAQAKQRVAFNVMVLGVQQLSSAAAAQMKRRQSGQIINVASTSAWTSAGNYAAIKAYVVALSQALSVELAGSGVNVTVVCPAWSSTNFHKAAGLAEPSWPRWLFVSPETVAKVGLKAAKNGKSLVVPTVLWKLLIFCLRHLPRCLVRRLSRRYMTSQGYKAKP